MHHKNVSVGCKKFYETHKIYYDSSYFETIGRRLWGGDKVGGSESLRFVDVYI
jgi:hypothetical protein